MRKANEENERIKREYMTYLKQAKGQDEKSVDKVLAAILKFEESTHFKPFKKFHIEQAGRFKDYLEKARHPRTGKPLSLSTTDATLRLVKGFFHWLAGKSGYKSRIRKTLTHFGNERCDNLEQMKAWSMNLGHENLGTTISAYMPVSKRRQGELIKSLQS